MIKSVFPQDMLNSVTGEFSIETVAAKLLYFQEQIHLLHWKTNSYAEHIALGSLYEYIEGFRDDVVEKLMGYTGRKVGLFKVESLADMVNSNEVVDNLITFSSSLMTWAKSNQYSDVDNLAQSLSGTAAKTKYLLTLS
jgi:hypothetical protein